VTDPRPDELSPQASRLVAVAAAAVAALVAVWAGARLAAYPQDLNLHEPPLAGLPASDVARAAGGGPRLARRVVMVILDGLTLAASRQLPNLDELRGRGASFRADAGFPTYSRAVDHVLLTGVDQEAGGVRLNSFVGPSRFDNLAARARAAGLRTTVVGNSLPMIGDLFGASFDRAVFGAGFDRELQDALERPGGLLVVHLAQVDLAGHAHGAASAEYRAAARTVDARLGRIVAALDLKRDAVVVVADHGHLARGGHGGAEPEARMVPLVLAGAGVRRSPEGEARLIDVAPTVAALLGLAPPGQLRGRPLLDVLELTEQERAAVWQAMFWARARSERYLGGLWRARRTLDVRRDEALKLLAAGHYETAYRGGEAIVREEAARAAAFRAGRVREARRDRAWPVGVGLLVALVGLVVLGRRRLIEPGAALLLGVLGPLLAAAAYLALGGTLSFSFIRQRDPFLARLALICVGAALVQVLLLATALGPRGPRRARRAAGLTLWTVLFAALPALACHVVVGPGKVVYLPSPPWTFAPILAYSVAAVVAGAAALFALVEGRARE
jgi:hypothetical protein